MRFPIMHAALTVAAVASFSPAALAQTSAALGMSGGVATDQFGQRAAAMSLSPSVSLTPGQGVAATLGGNVTRYANATWALGGALGLAAREPIGGGLTLTVDGSASATRVSGVSSGTFSVVDAIPALELRLGRFTLSGGARVSAGAATQETPMAGSPFPPFGGPQLRSESVTRTAAGPLYGITADLATDGDLSATIGAREERITVQGAVGVDRVASLALATSRVAFSATLGTRNVADDRAGIGSAALSFAIGPALALEFSAARYPANRLLGTPGGDAFSTGLTWRAIREPEWTPPTASRVPPPKRGMTRLAIRAPNARVVEVAGDFNEWTPVAARRAENGVWYADFAIPAGRYRYAFRVNEAEWRVPDGATAVDDGFGGKSAWLTVNEPARSR